MKLSGGAVLRLGLLVFAAVLVQVSGIAQVRILGASADLVPLLVAAVGFYGGSVAGAGAGFATGLLLDLALGRQLGLASLVLSSVGYAIGRFQEARDSGHGLVAAPVGAAATAAYGIGLSLLSFMLSIDASVSLLVFRDMLATVLLNALLALPVFALVRRVLRPVLLVDPSARRRRREIPAGPLGLRGLGRAP